MATITQGFCLSDIQNDLNRFEIEVRKYISRSQEKIKDGCSVVEFREIPSKLSDELLTLAMPFCKNEVGQLRLALYNYFRANSWGDVARDPTRITGTKEKLFKDVFNLTYNFIFPYMGEHPITIPG
jgi:hypothetical protein